MIGVWLIRRGRGSHTNMSLRSLPMDNKEAVACWPITRTIGRDLKKQLKRLFVFNSGKSAIFTTVNGDVYGLGLNPTGILGTGLCQGEACDKPTKLTSLKQGTRCVS